MSNLMDRVNRLKGMVSAMELNLNEDASRLMLEMLGLMGEMAQEMQQMQDAHAELNEYVESLDDDLADLAESLLDGGEDDEDDVQQALGAAAAAAVAEEALNNHSPSVTPEQIPDVAPVQPPVPFVMPVDGFPVGTPTDEDDLSDGFQVNLSFDDDEEGL